jgi:hypothetical protein
MVNVVLSTEELDPIARQIVLENLVLLFTQCYGRREKPDKLK